MEISACNPCSTPASTSSTTSSEIMSRVFTPPSFSSDPQDVVSHRAYADFGNIRKYRQRNDGVSYASRSHDIAIFIDGACVGNGTGYARAGMGVYFGPDSQYNMSERLDRGAQTNQRAELNAAIIALEKVISLLDDGGLRTQNVVLISDSSYVVQSMTNWVFKWKNNGWANHRGHEVTNRDDFEVLDDLIEDLDEDYSVKVQFWLIPRDYNQDADELARDSVE